jgi:peptidoglycan/xylan/chitin deacetylase (PgdA/CDA1 family)
MGGTVYLMYHELEQPGRPLCVDTPGYARYSVSTDDFRTQMRAIELAGLRGVSVGDALEHPRQGSIVVTFDDGSVSDWTVAAPVLQAHGFTATFYVTSGFIDTPGHLSSEQLRSLADAGFEIGCHSATHRFLTHATDEELHREVVGSRDRIHDVTGRAVSHFSCPGGRWNRRVQDAVRAAGYRSMATSRIGVNTSSTCRYQLARNPVLKGLEPAAFQRLCRADGLFAARLRQIVLQGAKGAFGDKVYGKVRSAALGLSRR